MGHGNRSGRDRRALEGVERRTMVLELRKSGLTNEAIGEKLGVSEAAIRKMIAKSLRDANLLEGVARDEYIKSELDSIDKDEQRAERMIARRLRTTSERTGSETDPFLPDKDAKVVLAALESKRKCREERAKYLQLYAPERQEVTGKDGGPIETRVTQDELLSRIARLAAAAGAGTDHPKPDDAGGEKPPV